MATRCGYGIYLFSKVSTPTGGYRVLSTEGKRQGHEADRSPPLSPKLKISGAIPGLPHTSSCL
jgi:hypothetical protein